MSHAKMNDFESEDVLHIMLSDEPEANSVEISPNITAELNDTVFIDSNIWLYRLMTDPISAKDEEMRKRSLAINLINDASITITAIALSAPKLLMRCVRFYVERHHSAKHKSSKSSAPLMSDVQLCN